MSENLRTLPSDASVAPGLLTAIHVVRGLTHVFLVVAGIATLVGMGDVTRQGFVGPLVCLGLFLISYFAWVGLVLFGCMNFSLLTMLGFVLALGAFIGLAMSGEDSLVAIGGLGLLALVFIAVIPISQYDPSTLRPARRQRVAPHASPLRLPEARSRGTTPDHT